MIDKISESYGEKGTAHKWRVSHALSLSEHRLSGKIRQSLYDIPYKNSLRLEYRRLFPIMVARLLLSQRGPGPEDFPDPVRDIVALPPSERILKLPVYAVVLVGANRMVMVHVPEGTSVAPLQVSLILLKGAAGDVTDVTWRFALPVFVAVSERFIVVFTVTAPKLSRVTLVVNNGAPTDTKTMSLIDVIIG